MNRRRLKPVVGLVGGVGSGKSSVARAFERLGGYVLDFDRLAHDLLIEREVVDQLRQWWGARVVGPDGQVDRAAVASIVFADATELARLEGLLYPRLKTRSADAVKALQADPGVAAIVLDAPKLFEAGLNTQCDAIVFVDADRPTRLKRVARSRGWDRTELARRENMQIPLDKKRSSADYVVENNGSTERLAEEVERVLKSVLSSFTQRSGG